MKKIIILLIIFSSCKKEVYYYPSKKFFDEHKPSEINIDNLNFKQITDSITNELFEHRNLFIQINEFNKIYYISPFTYTGGYIKERDLLEIINDTIFISNNKYNIKDLSKYLKVHYEKYGKENYLKIFKNRVLIKLVLKRNDKSVNLKKQLLKIVKTFNETNFAYKDSIQLNILLDSDYLERFYTIPPPPTIPIEIEEE